MPVQKKNWRLFEEDNETVSLSIFYWSIKGKSLSTIYKSYYNLEREKEANVLVISDGDKDTAQQLKACPDHFTD